MQPWSVARCFSASLPLIDNSFFRGTHPCSQLSTTGLLSFSTASAGAEKMPAGRALPFCFLSRMMMHKFVFPVLHVLHLVSLICVDKKRPLVCCMHRSPVSLISGNQLRPAAVLSCRTLKHSRPQRCVYTGYPVR